MLTEFSQILIDWYAINARDLPWRQNPDPYSIWVSEIMLQQTRVETVRAYFESWMERFPDIKTLANASLQEVMKKWEGLGYYSRARNLHRAAQIICTEYQGQLPESTEDLRGLPGIGRYTAGAIASIAFDRDEPVLDGNIRRVLARVFNIADPVRSPQGERRLWALAFENLPPGKASAYNQAMMDLGAAVCLPRSPRCTECPLTKLCQAYARGLQRERPVRKPRKAVPEYIVTAAVIRRDEQVLIAQRPLDGLLGGLWEFPGGKLEPGEDLVVCLLREIKEELGVDIHVGEMFGVYRHEYTHFKVQLHAFICWLTNGHEPQPLEVKAVQWVKPGNLNSYPMGKIDRQIAHRIAEEAGEAG